MGSAPMKTTTRAKTIKNNAKLSQLVRMKEGEVKSFDGTHIHYKSVGQGLPIVCCNGLGVPSFFFKYLENFFKHTHQVIIWDYRGHGESETPKKLDNTSVFALVEDCKAVLDHLKVKKAVLVGFSMGTQVILEMYRKYPRYIMGLIPLMGTYGNPMDTLYNSPFSKYIFEVVSFFATLFPKQGSVVSRFLLKNPFWYQLGGILKMIDTGMANKEDARVYIDHILGLDPIFFTDLVKNIQEHSTEDTLKKVKVPALVIGAENDQFTPVWIAKKMHRSIPNSELFIIKKGTHAAIVEQPELINLRIEKFLRERI